MEINCAQVPSSTLTAYYIYYDGKYTNSFSRIIFILAAWRRTRTCTHKATVAAATALTARNCRQLYLQRRRRVAWPKPRAHAHGRCAALAEVMTLSRVPDELMPAVLAFVEHIHTEQRAALSESPSICCSRIICSSICILHNVTLVTGFAVRRPTPQSPPRYHALAAASPAPPPPVIDCM